MVVTEKIELNGRIFKRTYSDDGFYIERDNTLYSEAIDVEDVSFIYNETDKKIESEETEINETSIITANEPIE